jgi:hypothetical protein
MRRTFILHAHGAKLPTDLLGLTSIRYGDVTDTEVDVVIQKLRKAIEDEGRIARIEGSWWQFSLTERSVREPSALSLLRITRDRDGARDRESTLDARAGASPFRLRLSPWQFAPPAG